MHFFQFQERHWTSPAMATTIQAAATSPKSDRLKQVLQMAPRFLALFFEVALRDVSNCMLLLACLSINLYIDAVSF